MGAAAGAAAEAGPGVEAVAKGGMARWAAAADGVERAEEATAAVMLEDDLAVMVAILAMVAPAALVAMQGERAAETEPQAQ